MKNYKIKNEQNIKLIKTKKPTKYKHFFIFCIT